MKKFILYFLISIITSCDDQTDSTVSGVIMPLKVGNYWTFADSSFDDNGLFVEVDTSTLSITGKKTIEYGGASYEVYLWTWITYGSDHSWLAGNGGDGLYIFGGTSPKGDYILTKSLSIKYPAETGDEWEEYNVMYSSLDSSFSISDTSLNSCTSTDAVLSSPLADFTCHQYEYSETFDVSKVMLKAAVGSGNQNAGFGKKRATTTVKLYYVPGIGYVGLVDEMDGIITYKKTIIAYLAEQ